MSHRSSYFYDSMEQLDRTFAGRSPATVTRATTPYQRGARRVDDCARKAARRAGLRLRNGGRRDAVATALADRRKSVVAADALYGATINLLLKVLEPVGVAVRFRGCVRLAACASR